MKNRPYIFLGAGGHSSVVMEILKLNKNALLGICDPSYNKPRGELCNFEEKEIESMPKDDIFLVNCIGSIKDTELRHRIFIKFKSLGFTFPTIIHPSVILATNVRLGEGVHLMAGSVIQPGSIIEDNCIINTHASIDHDCKIGESTHIAPGVTLSGSVVIGSQCHIGTGTVVIQNITIGDSSLIGAGSVITKNLPNKSCFINGR